MFPLRGLLDDAGTPLAVRNLACLVVLDHRITTSTLQGSFHVEAMLPLALFTLELARRKSRHFLFAAMLLVTLAIKEDMGIYLLGYAAVLGFVERKWARAGIVAGASLAAVALALGWGLPNARGGAAEYSFLHRWSRWGDDAPHVVMGMAAHPFEVIKALITKEHWLAFGGLLFAPFAEPARVLLFAAPWVVNATSGFAQQAQLSLYYGIPLLAFASLAAVQSLRGGVARRVIASRVAPVAAVLAIVLNVSHLSFPTIPGERADVLRAIRAIPDDVPVQAMSCFFPVLEYEREKHLIVPGSALVEKYALIRTNETTWPLSGGDVKRLVDEATVSGRYEVELARGSFLILRRRDDAVVGRRSRASRAAARRRRPRTRQVRATARRPQHAPSAWASGSSTASSALTFTHAK